MSRVEPKVKRNFSIEKETFDYLKEIQKENKNIKSMSSAIDLMAMEHKQKSETTTELMIKIIANEVAKELKNELKNIIIGVNSTDKHSQILIEMLNGLFIKNDVREILTSDIVKSEGLEIAESSVKKRIRKNRIRKLNNE